MDSEKNSNLRPYQLVLLITFEHMRI